MENPDRIDVAGILFYCLTLPVVYLILRHIHTM